MSFPYVLCAGQPGVGNQGKRLLRTLDGGRSWQVVTKVEIGQSMPAGHLGSGGYASSLYFLDANRGWMTFGGPAGGGILATEDGGYTWQGVGLGGQVQDVRAVDFPTRTQGYVVAWRAGRSFLLTTADGGRTWHAITLYAPDGQPAATAFVSPTRGVLLTDQNVLYRTDDGGQTWSASTP